MISDGCALNRRFWSRASANLPSTASHCRLWRPCLPEAGDSMVFAEARQLRPDATCRLQSLHPRQRWPEAPNAVRCTEDRSPAISNPPPERHLGLHAISSLAGHSRRNCSRCQRPSSCPGVAGCSAMPDELLTHGSDRRQPQSRQADLRLIGTRSPSIPSTAVGSRLIVSRWAAAAASALCAQSAQNDTWHSAATSATRSVAARDRWMRAVPGAVR